MFNRKRAAALLLGFAMTFSAVAPALPAYAAAWEKNSSGSYVSSDGSTISGVFSRGIDVSHWKQTIDWNQAAADDVNFVMLGTRYNNEADPYFGTNATGAFNAGIKVGAYIYSYATTTAIAESEADFVLNLIKDYPISYPVVIDIEDSSLSSLTPAQLAEIINAFCAKIESAGYYPMFYSNDYWLTNKIDMTKVRYDVWAARYDAKPTYSGAAMWQATNQGEINGISGAVDINFTLKDFSSKLTANRWRLINGQWYYYVNYVKQTGWINDGKSWYYLNSDGTQYKGWLQQDDKYYYLLPETGEMLIGWKEIDDKWYYMKSDGHMASEWLQLDDKYYYMLNGAMVTGWLRIGDDYYYLKGDGTMVTGWRKMDGAFYYFNTDGRLVRGWTNLDGKYYYLKSDGTMVTGWQVIDNLTYYFNPDGDMAAAWTKIDDSWYYFNQNGQMQTGWLQLDGKYYYLHTDGRMITGWQSDGTNKYYMDTVSGKMAVGWKEIGGSWYYFNQSGHMQTGWLQIDGKYYYTNPSDGKMAANGSYTIDNVNYTFNKSGVCQNEASAVDGGSAGSTILSGVTNITSSTAGTSISNNTTIVNSGNNGTGVSTVSPSTDTGSVTTGSSAAPGSTGTTSSASVGTIGTTTSSSPAGATGTTTSSNPAGTIGTTTSTPNTSSGTNSTNNLNEYQTGGPK